MTWGGLSALLLWFSQQTIQSIVFGWFGGELIQVGTAMITAQLLASVASIVIPFGGAALIVFGLYGLWDEARARRLYPNFDETDGRDTFRLFEAAALWVNQKPELPFTRAAKREFAKLKAAVDSRKLIVTSENVHDAVERALATQDGTGWATTHTEVKRRDLELWAAERNERPLFLFKSERGK